MHFVSDKSLQRPDWIYYHTGGGAYIGYPADIKPSINWNHIDGPVLYTSDGGIHWLTFWERIQMFFGCIDVRALDRKHKRLPL